MGESSVLDIKKCKIKHCGEIKFKTLQNLGRGKIFQYKEIGNKILVFKKGINILVTKEEFKNCFDILQR